MGESLSIPELDIEFKDDGGIENHPDVVVVVRLWIENGELHYGVKTKIAVEWDQGVAIGTTIDALKDYFETYCGPFSGLRPC